MIFIVAPIRALMDWWDLRKAQMRRDPHVIGMTLEEPFLKRMMGMVPFEGSKFRWCITLLVAGREDASTDRIFKKKRGLFS